MSFLNSLRAKLLLSVLFTGAVVLAAVGVTALFGYERVAQQVVQQRDTELVRVSAARLSEGLARHTRILQDTASDDSIRTMNTGQLWAALERHRSDLVAFDAGVVIYDVGGQAIYADTYAEDLIGESLSPPGIFEEVMETRGPVFSDIFTSPVSGDNVILAAVPVIGLDDEFQGVLVGMSNIHTSLVSATFAELLEFTPGSSGFAYLVDGTGKVIFHRNSTQIARDLSGIAPVSAAVDGRTGAFLSDDPDGTRVISGFAPVPNTSWGIVTQEEWEVIAQPIQDNNELTLALLLIGGVIASGVIAFEIGLIFRPIKDLTQGAQRIQGGDFDYRINPGTGDELDELAQQFNAMAADLKKSYSELEQRVIERTRLLRDSEERLRTVITSAPIILAAFDRNGVFTFLEGQSLSSLSDNPDPARTIGMSAFDVLDSHDDLRRALSGEAFTSIFELSGLTFEARYSPQFNEKGELEEVIGVATDITERRRAEQALMESEEEARRLAHENFSMAEIGRIISMPPDISEVYNRFAEQVHNLIPFDNIALSLVDMANHTFTVAYSAGAEVPSRQTGQPIPLKGSATEEMVVKRRGLLLDFEADKDEIESGYPGLIPLMNAGLKSYVGVPLVSQGDPIGALHVLSKEPNAYTDTDMALLDRVALQIAGAIAKAQIYQKQLAAEEALRIQAEDLRRSNADLEQFAYVASHDLQEPLRAIVGFTKMLARRYEGKLGDDADNYISRTVNASMRMQNLITDLLAYSRVGRNVETLEPVDLEEVLNDTLENLKASIDECDAVVTHDPLPTIIANNALIGQVLSNLISNAIKYRASDTTPHVHVSAARREREWLLSVRDNGIGIDPEFADRIFVIFQRLHGRTEYSGTGIGLAICKKAVERLGGRIRVESQQGEGSTFYFTIPVKVDQPTVAGVASSIVDGNRSSTGGSN
jgi:signal transduction histidine kinase